MIDQAKAYLNRVESATSTAEKQAAAAELQAFYQTLNDEEYEYIKKTLLTPRLNNLKTRMAELDESIENILTQSVED